MVRVQAPPRRHRALFPSTSKPLVLDRIIPRFFVLEKSRTICRRRLSIFSASAIRRSTCAVRGRPWNARSQSDADRSYAKRHDAGSKRHRREYPRCFQIFRLVAAYRRLCRQGSANSESHEGRSHQRYERLARPTVAMVRDRIAEADTGVARRTDRGQSAANAPRLGGIAWARCAKASCLAVEMRERSERQLDRRSLDSHIRLISPEDRCPGTSVA